MDQRAACFLHEAPDKAFSRKFVHPLLLGTAPIEMACGSSIEPYGHAHPTAGRQTFIYPALPTDSQRSQIGAGIVGEASVNVLTGQHPCSFVTMGKDVKTCQVALNNLVGEVLW